MKDAFILIVIFLKIQQATETTALIILEQKHGNYGKFCGTHTNKGIDKL